MSMYDEEKEEGEEVEQQDQDFYEEVDDFSKEDD
jgi:hypothetical protein